MLAPVFAQLHGGRLWVLAQELTPAAQVLVRGLVDVVDALGRFKFGLESLYLLKFHLDDRGLHPDIIPTRVCLQKFARLVARQGIPPLGEDLLVLQGRAGGPLQELVDVAVVGADSV